MLDLVRENASKQFEHPVHSKKKTVKLIFWNSLSQTSKLAKI